jgi:hypothetical protein
MTLKELKAYVNTIPEEMDDYNVVNGEFGLADDEMTFVMTNNEVLTIYVDQRNKEVQFLHQTDEDVKDILLDKDGDTE